MNDRHDVAELRAIAAALRGFVTRCDALLAVIGDKDTLTPSERKLVADLYLTLIVDLQWARATGCLMQDRTRPTRAELAWYASPACDAHERAHGLAGANPTPATYRAFLAQTRTILMAGVEKIEAALCRDG